MLEVNTTGRETAIDLSIEVGYSSTISMWSGEDAGNDLLYLRVSGMSKAWELTRQEAAALCASFSTSPFTHKPVQPIAIEVEGFGVIIHAKQTQKLIFIEENNTIRTFDLAWGVAPLLVLKLGEYAAWVKKQDDLDLNDDEDL